MTRAKKLRSETEVTVWPSSFPEDHVGSIAAADSSLDSDELGSHFMNDPAELHHRRHAQWDDEVEDVVFDARMGDALLRSFGLKPMPKRSTTFPKPLDAKVLPRLTAPRMPQDFDEFIVPANDIDLTGESVRDASLMDEEGDELGEVRSPSIMTDDVHTHGKRRGGHASLRPDGLKKTSLRPSDKKKTLRPTGEPEPQPRRRTR